MADRDGYIPGIPCWVDTSQPDVDAAIAFYGGLFGWEFEDTMPPGPDGSRYAMARIRGRDVAAVGSAREAATWNTYVSVRSADDTAAKVQAAGGTTVVDPFDVIDAGRMAVFADQEGALFSVWEARRHLGAGIVNEHGSLNFNGLNTRDPAAARAFYGAVFGWETLAMDGGLELWTLPGYGEHLERSDPGLRERLVEMGVDPRFADVVASINVISDDQRDVVAHWSVTFTVDDADGAARKATELGGNVLVPPFDAPWARTTIIADPQGATFIATKFAPENRELAASSEMSHA